MIRRKQVYRKMLGLSQDVTIVVLNLTLRFGVQRVQFVAIAAENLNAVETYDFSIDGLDSKR